MNIIRINKYLLIISLKIPLKQVFIPYENRQLKFTFNIVGRKSSENDIETPEKVFEKKGKKLM